LALVDVDAIGVFLRPHGIELLILSAVGCRRSYWWRRLGWPPQR